jgi:hypothetical protein
MKVIEVEDVFEKAFERAFTNALDKALRNRAEAMFTKALSDRGIAKRLEQKIEEGLNKFFHTRGTSCMASFSDSARKSSTVHALTGRTAR